MGCVYIFVTKLSKNSIALRLAVGKPHIFKNMMLFNELRTSAPNFFLGD